MKIFGIGLGKTGTTSLAKAMTILGYKSGHYISPKEYEHIDRFDFVCDMPVQTRFVELDKRFPGSKFIYTVRDFDSWIKSCEKWFVPEISNKHQLKNLPVAERRIEQFGLTYFERKQFTKIYHEHRDQVLGYFKDRPHDMLTINVCAGDGWEKLCPFLEKEIPNQPFPVENTLKVSSNPILSFVKKIKRYLPV